MSVINVDIKSFTIDQVGPLGTDNLTLATENVITNAITAAIISPSMILAQRDYGAVGNGIADDTTPLNNAIAAAIAQGKILFLESGAYRITSTLTSSAGFIMIGDTGVEIRTSTDINVINASGNLLTPYIIRNINFSSTTTKYVLNTTSSLFVIMENCISDQTGIINSSLSIDQLYISNCSMGAGTNALIQTTGPITTLTCVNSQIILQNDAEFIVCTDVTYMAIDNNIISSSNSADNAHLIRLSNTLYTATITNNLFTMDNSGDFKRFLSAAIIQNLIIDNCFININGATSVVIAAESIDKMHFSNCYIDMINDGVGIQLTEPNGLTNSSIEGCYFTNMVKLINTPAMSNVYINECIGGDITVATLVTPVDSSNVFITNNMCEFISCDVSQVASASGITITGNICTGIYCTIGAASTKFILIDNNITTIVDGIAFNQTAGVSLTESTISGNHITGPGTNVGINLPSNLLYENIQVTDNMINDFATGILLQSTTVTNCYVFGNYANATTPYTLDASLLNTGVLEFDITDPRGYTYTTAPTIDYSFINVVRDYGAVGDGVADDTIPLNNALTAGVTQGKPVFFPGGTYRTTGLLSVPASVTGFRMMGSSWHNAIIECDYVGNTLSFVGGNGIIIEDLTFNPQAATDGGVAITINPVTAGTTPSTDITIRNVHTGANAVLGALELIYCTDVTVTNCVFDAGDIQISGSTNKSANITLVNTFVQNVVLDSLCQDLVIDECRVMSAAGIGIECKNDGSTITNLTISNTLIDGAGNDGISLGSVSNVKIAGCTISNCTDAGINFLTAGTQENVIISDNSFITNDKGGINVRNTGSVTISDNKFDGNSVPADTYSGILADSSKTTGSFNVTGNTFVNAHQYSLDFDAAVTRFIIANNDMTGVTGTANTPAASAVKVIMANIG